MLQEERKEETAGVSNSNKSLNAERFHPVLSWSVDPISSLETELCLVALAVGRLFSAVIIHPTPPLVKVQFVQAVPPCQAQLAC